MDFVMQWLWYLVAFVAGSAAAWKIYPVWAKRAAGQREREIGAG